MHLLSIATAAVFVVGLVLGSDSNVEVDPLSARLRLLFLETMWELENNPMAAWAGGLVTLAGVELAWVGLSLVLMPWGARDEPLRQSLRNALTRTWLQSPHGMLVLLVVGGTIVQLGRANQSWWSLQVHPWELAMPVRPAWPRSDSDAARAEFTAALEAYQNHLDKAQQGMAEAILHKPWYLRYSDVITGIVLLGMLNWLLWGLLAAVGAPRQTERIPRPPLCESCGYILTSMSLHAQCPECGALVLASLGSEARPGCTWQKRRLLGVVNAFCRCTLEAALRPVKLARQLKVSTPVRDHRTFLALQLLVIATVISVLSVAGRAADPNEGWRGFQEGFLVGIGFNGLTSVVLIPILTCSAALLAGLYHSLRQGRNLMCGAIQLACYLSGYLGFVVAIVGATYLALGYFLDVRPTVSVDELLGNEAPLPLLAIAVWGLGSTLLAARYFYSLFQGTANMRFANT